MSQVLNLPGIVVLVGAMIAVITDVRNFKIYNLLTFPLLGAGLVYQVATNGWEGLYFGVLGVVAGFGMLLIPYLLGAMGAGDVKLMMAFGAWLGPQLTLVVLAIGLIGTAIYSFVLLIWQKRLGDSWTAFKMGWYQLIMMSQRFAGEGDLELEAVRDVVKQRERRRRLVPFSVMAALGLIICLVFGEALAGFFPHAR